MSLLKFRTVLREFIRFDLTEHEIITLVRYFKDPDLRINRLPTQQLFAMLQTELKRTHFCAFNETLATLKVNFLAKI